MSLAGALILAGVPTAIVVAQSGDDTAGSGTPEPVGNATPLQKDTPRVVARGTTAEGRTFTLQTARAGNLLCLRVDYGDFADGRERPDGALRVGGSEICLDPSEHPLAASMGQLFIDPDTGQVSDTPQRFVYGIVADRAKAVRVRGPAGKERTLETADVPDAPVRVFGGSAPGGVPRGTGSVIAEDASGKTVADQDLQFDDPAHESGP